MPAGRRGTGSSSVAAGGGQPSTHRDRAALLLSGLLVITQPPRLSPILSEPWPVCLLTPLAGGPKSSNGGGESGGTPAPWPLLWGEPRGQALVSHSVTL